MPHRRTVDLGRQKAAASKLSKSSISSQKHAKLIAVAIGPIGTMRGSSLLVLVTLALAATTSTSAQFNVISFSATTSTAWGPTSAPSCYEGRRVYTGVATCFGATWLGGKMSYGALTQIDPSGTSVRTIYSFNVVKGLTPSQGPILLSDKRTLVGTTSQGGSSGSGLIYAYDLPNCTMSTLASFTGPGGSTPQAPPIEVDGVLYGIAGQGGAYGYGVVWSLVSGGTIKVLHSFQGGANDTATPFGALTFNPADGLLYGMGFTAGANGLGGIFSLRRDGSGYTLRASLTQETGGAPQMGALVIGRDGGMFGNSWAGGAGGAGALFRFDPRTSALSTVFSYNATTGTQPYNGVAESPSGRWLYAVAWQGGQEGVGTVLAVAKDGSAFRVLLNLSLSQTGGLGVAGPTVTLDGARILTQLAGGGANGVGTLLAVDVPEELR